MLSTIPHRPSREEFDKVCQLVHYRKHRAATVFQRFLIAASLAALVLSGDEALRLLAFAGLAAGLLAEAWGWWRLYRFCRQLWDDTPLPEESVEYRFDDEGIELVCEPDASGRLAWDHFRKVIRQKDFYIFLINSWNFVYLRADRFKTPEDESRFQQLLRRRAPAFSPQG